MSTKVMEKPFTEEQEEAYKELFAVIQKYSKIDSPVHKGKLKTAEVKFCNAFANCLPIKLKIDRSLSFENLHILMFAIMDKVNTYRTIRIDNE